MPFTPFSTSEIRMIFEMSEGDGGGHAGRYHVNMSKEALSERALAYRGGGLSLRTSFLTFADQIKAALDVLNDPANDARLEEFRINAKVSDPGHFELKNMHLPNPVRMHYAIGGGAQIFPCQYFTMILHKRPGRPRDTHVVTFFGTMGPL